MKSLFDLEQDVKRVKHRGQRRHQASMQLAIDGVGYVTKTDKGGAYLHPITTNPAGDITKVKAIQVQESNRTRVPTGGQISVDSGKTFTKSNVEYVYAQYNNKTGAVRKSSIVVLAAAAVPATVVRSDVKVTDTGIEEQQGTMLYRTTPRVDASGRLTAFLESGEIKTLPLGTKISIQPGTRSSNDDNIWWAMHVNGADSKFGAVNRAHVVIEGQAQNIPIPVPSWPPFFQACWTTPWLKALLRGYLRSIFSAENIDFLRAVAQIRNAAQARQVLDRFVRTGSKQEVNVSYDVRRNLINAITNPPPNNYPDWRVPFGFNEANGTTFEEHKVAAGACDEIYKIILTTPKPQMRNVNKLKTYIAALIKDPND